MHEEPGSSLADVGLRPGDGRDTALTPQREGAHQGPSSAPLGEPEGPEHSQFRAEGHGVCAIVSQAGGRGPQLNPLNQWQCVPRGVLRTLRPVLGAGPGGRSRSSVAGQVRPRWKWFSTPLLSLPP